MSYKEIQCIDRLFHLNPQLDEMLEFFLQEKIIEPSELPSLKREVKKSEYLYNAMQLAKQKEIITLLDFEWSVLPVERIKITIITTRSSKEFSYGQ